VTPLVLLALLFTTSAAAFERKTPPKASLDGAYYDLLQVLHCPQDAARYGEFHDYGHWRGGPWCGQQGKAGYWVWVKPNWYVWEGLEDPHHSGDYDYRRASVNGQYQHLLQTLYCPQDAARYGEFHDYGHWRGGPWCGQQGKAGYWVWVKPNWYVWTEKR